MQMTIYRSGRVPPAQAPRRGGGTPASGQPRRGTHAPHRETGRLYRRKSRRPLQSRALPLLAAGGCVGFGALPRRNGKFPAPVRFLAGREVKTCFMIPPLSEKPSAGVFSFPSGLRSRRFPFPAFSFAAFPLRMFYFPPACRTAHLVLWPGAGTKKPPGNRRLSLLGSRVV